MAALKTINELHGWHNPPSPVPSLSFPLFFSPQDWELITVAPDCILNDGTT